VKYFHAVVVAPVALLLLLFLSLVPEFVATPPQVCIFLATTSDDFIKSGGEFV